MMKPYYKNMIVLEKLGAIPEPTKVDFQKVFKIIKDDVELSLYFYDVLNPGWVELLDKAGEFEELREKETGMIGKYKAHYLKGCAENKAKAEAVLGIIEKINAQDINIQGTLVRAIVQMPEETAVKGVELVTRYLNEPGYKFWYGIGMVAAELMIKLMTNRPDKAFEVAESLLDVRVSEENTYGKDIVAKFSTDEYSTLMLEHYKKVWEMKPWRAINILINILHRCIEALDSKEDASRFLGYGLELGDLNDIDMQHPNIESVLVKGICEAGKVLIDKEPEKIKEFFDLLEGKNKVIFLRIVMYLLRFVKSGTEVKRVNKFVGNSEYFEEYNPCWNEHRRLLNDKFNDVNDEVKEKFIDWVKALEITEERKKEIIEWYQRDKGALPDFDKWENQLKAKELYFVREKFKDEYEKYKNGAGVKNDSELAPRNMVGEARTVSPMEGTPLSAEDMASKTCDEVLDYLLEPKNYVEEGRTHEWGSKKSALAATFRYDVKKRYKDYLECGVEKRKKLPVSFLASLFYGEQEAAREGSFAKKEWNLLIDFASLIVEEKHEDQEYRDCFSAILFILHGGFGEGKSKLELDESTAKKFWGILEKLVYFPAENIDNENERDPVQLKFRHVTGEALGLTISLGSMCKQEYSEYWENELKAKTRQCWEYTLKNISEPGINCVFGLEFSRIHWLDTKWVEENLDLIFKDELWDETWGTYTSWGRPSYEGFKLLVDKGKYKIAVDKIGAENKFKFGKEPDKGLIEHLMIGYFNEWVDYEHEVLQKFFEKAPADLRAKAARFLSTGFKDINERGGSEKEKVAARLKQYWEGRLVMMDEGEAVGFMKWVNDSVLGGAETLSFLNRTLEVSGGKLSKHGDSKGLVEGICKFGKEKGNELLALQCLKKAAIDENMHTTWSSLQGPLVSFLSTMVDKSKDIRAAAMEVADLYGRYNSKDFREVWEKLSEKS